MVSSTNLDKPDAKTIPTERASLVSSTKMHLGVSLAQVLHLKETGTLPEEISDTITQLYDTIGNPSRAVPALEASPESPGFEIQEPPCMMNAPKDYTSGDHRGVVARSGDSLLVFGWYNDGNDALAYNTRNETSGRIPLKSDRYSLESFMESQLYMVTKDEPSASIDEVSLKKGDYIRAWDCRHGVYLDSGKCFNLASGEIGTYSTAHPLKLLD